MAININAKRSQYPTRCKYYSAKYVDNNTQLVPDAICKGVFYCTDKVQYGEHQETQGYATIKVKTLTIETSDFIPDLQVNDYVEYARELWRVNSIPEADDLTKNKFYSSRPMTKYTIELRK